MPSAEPHSTPPTPTDRDLRTTSLHLEISRQARNLWEKYGRPAGRDVPIWLEAEQQVLGTDPNVRQQAGATVAAAPLAETLYPTLPPRGTDGEPAALPRQSSL